MDEQKPKTGMFYIKANRRSEQASGEKTTDQQLQGTDIVVMDKGIEIARYSSVEEFVAKHREGLYAIGRLEENMEKAIESHYTPYPADPTR